MPELGGELDKNRGKLSRGAESPEGKGQTQWVTQAPGGEAASPARLLGLEKRAREQQSRPSCSHHGQPAACPVWGLWFGEQRFNVSSAGAEDGPKIPVGKPGGGVWAKKEVGGWGGMEEERDF